MINLPQTLLELVKSWNVRHCVEINFSNGLKVYPDYEESDLIKLLSDISFESGISLLADYDLGNVIFKTLKFSLLTLGKDYSKYSWNNTTCEVNYLILKYDALDFDRIYMGRYIVLADVIKRSETINITAYDQLYRSLIVDAQSWFTENVTFPIKVGDLLNKISQQIDVQIDQENYLSLPNKDIDILEATLLGGKTLRDVLGWIGTICCGNVCMCVDYTGTDYVETLKILGIKNNTTTILDSSEGLFGELLKSDYTTLGYQTINVTIDAYNTRLSKLTGADGSLYNINGNGILHVLNSALVQILDSNLNTLLGVKYTPYTLPLNMPYFLIYQPGDLINIDFFNEQFTLPITYILCDGILTCNNNLFLFKGLEYKVGDNLQSQNISNAVTLSVTDIPNAIINTEDTEHNALLTKWIYGDEDVNIEIKAYFDDDMHTTRLFINGEEIPVTNNTGIID